MRTHGWGGDPPETDGEARARIVAAVRRRLDGTGKVSISDLAHDLAVTRQTVYRYYADAEALLDAAAVAAMGDVLDLVVQGGHDRLAAGGDSADALIEMFVETYTRLRDDPALARLLAPGRIDDTLAGITADSSFALGRSILGSLPLDDSFDPTTLIEPLLRTLQSFVLDPGDPPRTGDEVRTYLQRWLAPALRVAQHQG